MSNLADASPVPPALVVRDLHVTLHRDTQVSPALRGVNLKIARGEIVALVGESGSGKSTLGLAIQGLLPAESQPHISGSIQVGGLEVAGASASTLRRLRRQYLGAIFQDPMTSLNPTMRTGQQLLENIEDGTSPAQWLARVGIASPESRLPAYPHQLSGGQRQRVMIAMAMACHPTLVIADEPTTALDVTVQAQILRLIRQLSREAKTAFLFITHDLAVAATIADRIAVLYAGQVVETGPLAEIMKSPAHPYTAALLQARFGLKANKSHQLPTLGGDSPAFTHSRRGCAFAPRCLLAVEKCFQNLPVLSPVKQHSGAAACWRADEVTADIWQQAIKPWPGGAPVAPKPLLKISGLSKSYSAPRRGLWGRSEAIPALRSINLEVFDGESVALVGESGSGKSTLLRIVAGLVRPDRGEVVLNSPEGPQMVFQDAAASLTPWLSVEELVGERLRRRKLSRTQIRRQVLETLEMVGLPAEISQATTAELSGGQCQRVAIARAVVVPPRLLLCDEPVSAMDVSLAAAILNLLGSLQRRLQMAMLFVTHDLAAARFIADRIVVMRAGEVVEIAPAEVAVQQPQHPYTRDLLAAMPDQLMGALL